MRPTKYDEPLVKRHVMFTDSMWHDLKNQAQIVSYKLGRPISIGHLVRQACEGFLKRLKS